ncbi:MAG: hypothetical protein K0R72_156 [Clostridia bacterium]|jgi:hypothetical protein|nr:hypothetical protein [Clostridia bacterium]
MNDIYEELCKNLDKNEQKILSETIAVTETANKLSFNFFAMGIRELIRVYLDRNSNDEEIKKCIWYKEFNYDENSINKITRQQRMAYLICGGLSIENIKNELKIDINKYTQSLNNIINKLSKYIHINEVKCEKNNDTVQETLLIFLEFINDINEFRNEFRNVYLNFINDIIKEELMNKNIDEIDILATHYENVIFDLEELEIDNIDSEFVYFNASGEVSVIHQYGSDHDNRMDNGLRINSSYPVTCKLKLNVEEAFVNDEYNIELENLLVDTSSFYE